MNNGYCTVFNLYDQKKWEAVQETICHFDDICFRNEYYKLYETEGISTETFCYQCHDNMFLITYYKQSIGDSRFFDFETAYGYTGPLSTTDNSGFLKRAWDSFYQYCHENNIICGFIRFNPILNNHVFIDPNCVEAFKEKDIVVLEIDNKSEAEIWAQYSQNNRNKIKRAIKNKVVISGNATMDALLLFKQMYYESLDGLKAEKFYYFDDSFFRRIDGYLKNNYMLFIASAQGKPLGGALVFFTKKILYYFLSAVADEGRRLGVANLLRHEVVKFAKCQGIVCINFGGGRTTDKDDSLLKFKKSFSTCTKDFYVGKFIVNKDEYDRFCGEWENISSKEKIQAYGSRFLKYRS